MCEKASDLRKRDHSWTLLDLLRITHSLPLVCKSDDIIRHSPEDPAGFGKWVQDLRVEQALGGWNDHIAQPARDAILYYYKVCACNISLFLASSSLYIYSQHNAEPSNIIAQCRAIQHNSTCMHRHNLS